MGFLRFLSRFRIKRKDHKRRCLDHKNGKNGSGISPGTFQFDFSGRKFTWSQIEICTGNFSTVVGSGGFSNVYLARINGGGGGGGGGTTTVAAVKILGFSERLHRIFKRELDILLQIRHQNIVTFIGYCDEREEGALVFEYVPNGNLQEKLHGRPAAALPWRNRMIIAFQLALAIEYLHEKCTLQIVHGDIKASNILLDERLNCKLCDFGSAKMGFSSTVANPSNPFRAKQLMIGSPGYTDPQYLRTGIASKKNDIYSFGVVVLELITGKEAFCSERGQMLTSILSPVLTGGGIEPEEVAKIVDPRLNGDFDVEEARELVSIASLCLSQSPSPRPSISRVQQLMREKILSISSEKVSKN